MSDAPLADAPVPGAPVRTLDGNQAVTSVAYRLSEVIAIYPITPSSSMGEESDELASRGTPNLWGTVPTVVEMQSEGGAAGAVHGALSAGALATTFTASQGLLLMIPNLYKIAGELTAFCMHVSARTIATHALSIFGDHSDVMACRQTGFAMLCSGSVQEAQDMAAIASATTLAARVPFLHFFDGFRTSHEVSKIETLPDDTLRALVDDEAIAAHRARALSPDHPVLRGSAANPDTFFQAREACNPYYASCAALVAETMARFATLTGRRYGLVDYVGHPDAERVIVMMGSGAETAHELVEHANARGEMLGVLKVRLYRPFPAAALLAAMPRSVKAIAVLDRTKEPGALGEPLYQDVRTALSEAVEDGTLAAMPRVIGGRYGLSSKEFTPAMVRAVFDELARESGHGDASHGHTPPRRRFTVGIVDDVSHLSLPVDASFDIEKDDVVRAVFYGLGADGTVGANKSSIKILGEETDRFVQGYFVYDSKKSGAITISHLRFGPRPIRSSYLVRSASFVAVHQWGFFDRYDVLELAREGATLLVSSPHSPEATWDAMPRAIQEEVLAKKIRVFTIDANAVARAAGMGNRINTIMQTCFFALSGVFDRDTAIGFIKRSIEKTYRLKGPEVVARNFAVVDAALSHLYEVPTPAITSSRAMPPVVSPRAPDFVQRVTATMLAGKGDALPVSAFPVDGTWPTGTSKWEKRAIADAIPVWDESICIQCNKCAMVCPHAAIRVKVYDPSELERRPPTFKSMTYKGTEFRGSGYTVQVAPEDCTGCTLCVEVCPAKDKANPRHKALDMAPMRPLAPPSARTRLLPRAAGGPRTKVRLDVKEAQLLEPLFEFSGACSGCGETPYLKLVTQLFGDRRDRQRHRLLVDLRRQPAHHAVHDEPRGARPGLGELALRGQRRVRARHAPRHRHHARHARELLAALGSALPEALVAATLASRGRDEASLAAQRARVSELRPLLAAMSDPRAKRLGAILDYLVEKSVWIVGGDGWAYDIGYGGLDHVLASGANVNLLVLDTEVYSNTGGQQSKATPLGASAKFAAKGKATPKKDLALLAHHLRQRLRRARRLRRQGRADRQRLPRGRVLRRALADHRLLHCIAHGYDLAQGLAQQKKAVETGYWPLFRHDPRRAAPGESPLKLDSAAPKGRLVDHLRVESRFRAIEQEDPDRFRMLADAAQAHVHTHYALWSSASRTRAPPRS
jgi:pyruvate-ferredoxin/flavodoxin oxidoreductase